MKPRPPWAGFFFGRYVFGRASGFVIASMHSAKASRIHLRSLSASRSALAMSSRRRQANASAVPECGTACTLVALMKRLVRAGIECEMQGIDSADIVTARNMFATNVVRSKKFDGLLFVDSDMRFRPELVMKMLAFGVEATAAAYTK